MEPIKIEAAERTEMGSGAVRRLRRAGMIPGSVMRMNKGGTLLVKFNAHDFMMAMRGHTSKQVLAMLEMNGTTVPALMREMQNDVIAGTPIHVDFSEVSLEQKVRVTIPVYLTGEAVGVKIGGGVLEQVLRNVVVDCLPTALVEKFTVDVSKLGLDQTIFARDLNLGADFTLVTRGELAIATVKNPDGDSAAKPGAPGAAEEAKSPDVIKKGKEETKEGAAPAAK